MSLNKGGIASQNVLRSLVPYLCIAFALECILGKSFAVYTTIFMNKGLQKSHRPNHTETIPEQQ